MSTHILEEILHPKSIAVIGASSNPSTRGYNFIRHLLDYGYRGNIYPINPRYPEILGIKSYPNIRDVPEPVDYVISCVPASAVLGILEDCSQKRVKCIHLFTARFSETGHPEDANLEQEILKQARKRGIRLIGPNCMGVYYPLEGISFGYDFPKEPGSVGLASQTGGGAATIVELASMRGIRFSKVISYGNALDLNECDYLDYFCQDRETRIILMYVEGVRDGKRFLNSLRQAAATKPVIIVKGGRGESGVRAAASHTASLAGTAKTWETAIAQAGAISIQNFDEMTDLAVSFYFLPPILGERVGIIGGGGGLSVLAADECEEAGLDVIPLPMEIREELRSKSNPIWDWVQNPIDASILGSSGLTIIDMLKMMDRDQNFDLILIIVPEFPLSRKEETILRLNSEAKGYIKVKKESSKPSLAVIRERSLGTKDYSHWRWKLTAEVRTRFIQANIPFYPTTGRAAQAVRKLIDYYQRRG